MIKKILRELYMLPRGEQRAVILLSLLLIFSILIRLAVQVMPGRAPSGLDSFVKESQAIIASIQKKDSLRRTVTNHQPPFTPHHSPLTPHQPTTTIHQPPITNHQSPLTNHQQPTNKFLPVNINTCDSAMLLPLPGIGPVFAKRIIKYRDLLGGFTRFEQLYEVYGLKEETILMIREYITIDTTAIRKIFLDSASFRNLLRHPYLQLEDVKLLVEYRDYMGGIKSMKEIRENRLLSDSVLQKLGPYFRFSFDDVQNQTPNSVIPPKKSIIDQQL